MPAFLASLASDADDVRAVLAQLLRPRIEALCAAVGPWLVLDPDAAARAMAREELAAQLVEELALAADQAAAVALPEVSSQAELRARDLLAALRGTDAP
jgi:hypothetical protein